MYIALSTDICLLGSEVYTAIPTTQLPYVYRRPTIIPTMAEKGTCMKRQGEECPKPEETEQVMDATQGRSRVVPVSEGMARPEQEAFRMFGRDSGYNDDTWLALVSVHAVQLCVCYSR